MLAVDQGAAGAEEGYISTALLLAGHRISPAGAQPTVKLGIGQKSHPASLYLSEV